MIPFVTWYFNEFRIRQFSYLIRLFVAFNYIMLYEVYLQNRWSSNYRIESSKSLNRRRLYDENSFRPIIRVNSSKKIKYYFIPFRWFHIQTNISVVSFTIIMIICNCARRLDVVLKLVFVLFIWARDISSTRRRMAVPFRPLAGVWLSAIACQHQCNVYFSFGRKWILWRL